MTIEALRLLKTGFRSRRISAAQLNFAQVQIGHGAIRRHCHAVRGLFQRIRRVAKHHIGISQYHLRFNILRVAMEYQQRAIFCFLPLPARELQLAKRHLGSPIFWLQLDGL